MKITPNRILLIKPSSMGDVIHSLPLLAALHHHWPEAEIRWIINPAWSALIENNPAISETILFPRDSFRGLFGLGAAWLWARKLKSWKPDLAIDLQGLLRSALMARYSEASRIVGLSDAREGAGMFYSAKACVNANMHAVERYLCVLDLLRVPRQAPQFFLPEGKLPDGFSTSEKFVVLHPYARGKGKNLNQEQVKAFASALENIPLILVGRGEKYTDLPSNVIDWSERTTLLELIGILRQASFIISSDSGPMHLAAALQPERTMAIHRWTDPLSVGPWSKKSLVWKNGVIKKVEDLTEVFRAPGPTPTLDEMKDLGHLISSFQENWR